MILAAEYDSPNEEYTKALEAEFTSLINESNSEDFCKEVSYKVDSRVQLYNNSKDALLSPLNSLESILEDKYGEDFVSQSRRLEGLGDAYIDSHERLIEKLNDFKELACNKENSEISDEGLARAFLDIESALLLTRAEIVRIKSYLESQFNVQTGG